MTEESKRTWAVVIGVAALVLLVLLLGRARRELRPEPVRAWVAIEPEGSGLARAGRVELEPGGSFTLHAVLEATTWRDGSLYYTEAERLELPGGEVPEEALRPWAGPDEVRILWFTVEGSPPYLEVGGEADLARFQFREHFRAEWPLTWSVPGSLEPGRSGVLVGERRRIPFGTQRFHVRIELFGPESAIRPRQRFSSPEAAELPGRAEEFPTAIAALPGALGPPSRAFGLTQIAFQGRPEGEQLARVVEWMDRDLAFARLPLIRRSLDRSGIGLEGLVWKPVDLEAGAPWGAAGDLLRAGERWVFLYQDLGQPGILDEEDLCLDFDKGPAVRRLREIFMGEGLVERAELSQARAAEGASR